MITAMTKSMIPKKSAPQKRSRYSKLISFKEALVAVVGIAHLKSEIQKARDN